MPDAALLDGSREFPQGLAMSRSPRVGAALALLCLLLLGALPILASAKPGGVDGLTFAIWLTLWQLACALPLLLLERRRRRVAMAGRGRPRGRTLAIALLTGAMFGLSTYMYVVAAERAGPVSLAIALQAYPLFAILLEWLLFGKRKTRAELALTALLILALAYLTTGGTFRVSQVSWWSAFALGIPLLWSIAHILLKRLLDTTPITPNQVTVSRLAISGACLLLLQLALGQSGQLGATLLDGELQRAAALMGLAYYCELILWFHAMRHIEVSVASSLTVPAPAVTLLLAVLFLGAPVETYQVVAMSVIALGLYGLVYAGWRAAAVAAQTR